MNITTAVTTRPERTDRLWAAYVQVLPVFLAEEKAEYPYPEAKRYWAAAEKAWRAATVACLEFDGRTEAIAAFNAEVSK